jgi:hypothetical protein
VDEDGAARERRGERLDLVLVRHGQAPERLKSVRA